MKKHYLIWLIFGAYGVWFAVLSGMEELAAGKYWKVLLALILGAVSYWLFEHKIKKK